MTTRRDLMNLVGYVADYDDDVWMRTNNPSSVNWTVTLRQEWEGGIDTRETPRRVAGLGERRGPSGPCPPALSLLNFCGRKTGENGERICRSPGIRRPARASDC